MYMADNMRQAALLGRSRNEGPAQEMTAELTLFTPIKEKVPANRAEAFMRDPSENPLHLPSQGVELQHAYRREARYSTTRWTGELATNPPETADISLTPPSRMSRLAAAILGKQSNYKVHGNTPSYSTAANPYKKV